jgi:hypothetical protein
MARTRNTDTPATTAPAITADFITSGLKVTANVPGVKTLAQPKNKRSEAQKALDGVVPQIHAAWVEAGKPSAFAKLPTVSYPVDPERSSNLHGMIRKAADLHGLRARFGQDVTVTPEVAKALELNDAQIGSVLVTFAIMDKSSKNGASENGDSEDASADES